MLTKYIVGIVLIKYVVFQKLMNNIKMTGSYQSKYLTHKKRLKIFVNEYKCAKSYTLCAYTCFFVINYYLDRKSHIYIFI